MNHDQHARASFTDRAVALAAGAVTVVVVGALLRYLELVVLGGVTLLLVVAARAWPGVRSELGLERTNVPPLVARDSTFRYELSIEPARAIADLTLVDQFGGVAVAPLHLVGVSADGTTVAEQRVRADRRGEHLLGPVLEVRHDPLALVRRDVVHELVDHVLVHPRIHSLRVLASTTERPVGWRAFVRSANDPLAEFRTLREYVPGDDDRLVHWPTAARLGQLMVREHLETRQHRIAVVLDCDSALGPDGPFEEAVEIACSLVCDAMDQRYDVIARTNCPSAPGARGPVPHREAALDLFARVHQVPPQHAVAAHLLHLGGGGTVDATILVAPGWSRLREPLGRDVGRAGVLRSVLVGDHVAHRGVDRRPDGSAAFVSSAADFAVLWRSGALPWR